MCSIPIAALISLGPPYAPRRRLQFNRRSTAIPGSEMPDCPGTHIVRPTVLTAAWQCVHVGRREVHSEVLSPFCAATERGSRLGGPVIVVGAATWASCSRTPPRSGEIRSGSQDFHSKAFNGKTFTAN